MGNIVHASIDERGSISGGQAGDQNGKEVCVRGWYNKPWNVMIRCKNKEQAQKAVAIAVKLANSRLVGYDQGGRNTLYSALKKHKFDVDAYIASKEKTETDCSAFVYACYCCVNSKLRNYIKNNHNSPTTSTSVSAYSGHGFSIHRDSKFLSTDKNLRLGDMVCNTGHHIAMYIANTADADSIDTSPAGNSSETGPLFDHTNDRNDALIREIGYLDAKCEPSITPSDITISLLNTTTLLEALYGGQDATSSEVYDIDKLSSKQREVIEFLNEKNLNLAASVGILANIEHEAPGVNTAAVGDHGTSFGICQWHNERGKAMKKYAKPDWKTNLTGQLKYLWHELTTGYKGVLKPIKKVPNTLAGCKQAADIFVRKFEVPANVDTQSSLRQKTAEELWKKCSITVNYTNAEDKSKPPIPDGKQGKTIVIPSSVKQTGLIPNYTNYSYYYPKWTKGTTQRKVADLWHKTGRHQKGHIATISGYYLVALSPIFGQCGDVVTLNIAGGGSFSAIIADTKGGDATNPYGHVLGGKVDIVEWEMAGKASSSTDSATQTKMSCAGYKGKRVVSIINYGKYKGLK